MAAVAVEARDKELASATGKVMQLARARLWRARGRRRPARATTGPSGARGRRRHGASGRRRTGLEPEVEVRRGRRRPARVRSSRRETTGLGGARGRRRRGAWGRGSWGQRRRGRRE
jgi:hypothetical protein